MRKAVKVMLKTRQGQMTMIVDSLGVFAVIAMAIGVLHLPSL